MPNTTPAFNLKAVLNETGIAADTLRAWERRYGLPLPERTPGGHRLYSQHDIETVKWLMERQEEGLSISRAVDLWNELTGAGRDPLAESRSQAAPALTPLPGASSLESLREAWLTACLAFDEPEAENTLNQAFGVYPVEQVCTEILQRGLAEIGTQWYQARATVQQEHFASALALRRLDALISAAPHPTRRGTILVGCAAGEWHTFTPLLLTLFLRRRGWNVIYLGANVPAEQFQETVSAVSAGMVILVAQQLMTAAALQQVAAMLNASGERVAFGGRIFTLQPQLAARVPGHYLGPTLDSAIRQIESLMAAPGPNPGTALVSDTYFLAASTFQARRPQIEASVHQSANEKGFSSSAMETAVDFLGDNILSALKLGDMGLVDGEIDWVRSLLKANHVPDQALGEFMHLYAEAVNLHINGSGKPIIEWLNNF